MILARTRLRSAALLVYNEYLMRTPLGEVDLFHSVTVMRYKEKKLIKVSFIMTVCLVVLPQASHHQLEYLPIDGIKRPQFSIQSVAHWTSIAQHC